MLLIKDLATGLEDQDLDSADQDLVLAALVVAGLDLVLDYHS